MNGTLTIHFHSDTCFSMPAALDATVDTDFAYDELGLPTIPGKTLHGLLRDTLLSCADVLGYSVQEDWALLGRPLSHDQEGLLRIGNAHTPVAVQAWAKWAQKRADNALTWRDVHAAFAVERTLTKQDRETGAPAQETLRRIRVVPQNTVLEAPVHLMQSLTARQQELLQLLCGLTRHVGLDRNRGLGYVELKLLLPENAQTPALPTGTVAKTTGAAVFLPIHLTLSAPCLVSDQAVEPNSSVTRSIVPGATLRGAVAAALLRGNCPPSLFEDIVVNGTVRFLNAYPQFNSKRSLPVPITWQRDKDASQPDDGKAEPEDALTALFEETDEEVERPQRQPVQGRFYALSGNTHYTDKVKKTRRTHQTRSRSTGVTNAGGEDTVFVYESLDAGQTFSGAVAVPEHRTDLQNILRTVLAGNLWLGRSARSGYGGAPRVETGALEVVEPGGNHKTIGKGEQFRVRLTSEAVLRDPITGQHDPAALAAALEALFNGIASLVTFEGTPAVCIKQERVVGYHRLWRTHRGEFPCAAAGSVALFQSLEELSKEKIAALQAVPLGERVAEGGGCFVIEPLDSYLTLKTATAVSNRAVEMPTVPVPDQLKEAQRRLYRAEIAQLIAQQAQELAGKAGRLPSVSLIQRLRIPLRSPNWRGTYRQWLNPNPSGKEQELVLKKAALDPLKKAVINGERMTDFLRKAAGEDALPPLPSNAESVLQRLSLLDKKTAEQIWNEELRNASVAFLDTLLGHLAKRIRRQNESAEGANNR